MFYTPFESYDSGLSNEHIFRENERFLTSNGRSKDDDAAILALSENYGNPRGGCGFCTGAKTSARTRPVETRPASPAGSANPCQSLDVVAFEAGQLFDVKVVVNASHVGREFESVGEVGGAFDNLEGA